VRSWTDTDLKEVMERAEIYYVFHAYCVIAPWSLREIQRAKGGRGCN
jgi:hypothetical protein